MTTPSTERKAGPLLGTGAQTTWPFTFKVFAATDIAVTIADSLGVETALAYGVDYTVTLNANQETSPGGTVTYPISGSPLPTGSRLVIVGNLPYDQPLDLPAGGNFSPLALENQLDRTVMQIQQLAEKTGRALQVSITTDADVTLPPPAASQLIGWDSTGENLQNVPLTDIGTAIAYGTYRYDTFTGNGSTTTFALSEDPAALANLDVSISGVVQVPGTDYSLVNGSLVFASAPANGTTVLARYGQALPSIPDSDQVSFVQAGVGAVTRTVQNKLREAISVKDFGAVGDGSTDDTAAIQAALNTGKDVFVPDGNYLATDTLQIKTAYQSFFGSGEGSQITFTFSTSKPGLAIVPNAGLSTENVTVRQLYLFGTANVSKLVSVGGNLCNIFQNRLVNNTAGGSVIYLEDEDAPTGVYCFGERIINNRIYGSLTAGATAIRLGLYSQGSTVAFNTIENAGTMLFVNGASTNLTIDSNIFQRCLTTEYAIRIYRSGSSGQPMYAINFTRNYFEEVQKVFKLEDGLFSNIEISNNYAFRNTANKVGSYFYEGGVGTAASSGKFVVNNNHVQGYDRMFNLTDEYSALYLDAKNNYLSSLNGYTTGTYADYAYKVRAINAYFNKVITAGSFVAQNPTRLEATSVTFRVPLDLYTQEFIEKITFFYISVGVGSATVTIYRDGNNIGSVTTTPGANSTFTINLNTTVYPQDRGGTYWAEIQMTDTIAGYIYPLNIYTR